MWILKSFMKKMLHAITIARITKCYFSRKLPATKADKCRHSKLFFDRPTSLLVAVTCTT